MLFFFPIHHLFESYISHLSLCWLWPPLEMTKRSKSINSKILTLQTPFLGNSIYMINVSFGALFRKDVIPNFENTYNLTILCNLHFTIIFNTTYSKPSISSNLRTLQIRSSHARLSGSYNTKHCQDNTICLLAKKKNLLCDVTNVYVSHRVSRTSECIFFHGCHNDDIWVNSRR